MALETIMSVVYLDVYDHDTTPTTIKTIALDNETRVVRAYLQKQGDIYQPDENADVELIAFRPDRTGVIAAGSVVELEPAIYQEDEENPGEEILVEPAIYGVEAVITQGMLAVAGQVQFQFKLSFYGEELRTEIFIANNGRALDSTTKWINDYEGWDLSEFDSRLKDLEGNTIATYVGETPIEISEETVVRLMSEGQATFNLTGKFVADYDHNERVSIRNVTVTRENGRMVFTCTGDAMADCRVDFVLKLEVGRTYRLNVHRTYQSGTTGGRFQIYDDNGDSVAYLEVVDDEETLEFTVPTADCRLRYYPVTAYYWDPPYNFREGIINSFEVTTDITGTFRKSKNLGVVSSGATILASPNCEVYSLTEKVGIRVDDELSTTSRNAVANRRITGAIGSLANLSTANKTNLVSAINEVMLTAGSRLSGKKCVFLGDSVSAFQKPPNDIPSLVGQYTGMNVVNGAFGGCRITDTVDYTQDGYGAFSMVRLTDSIISGSWTIQDNGISDLTAVETEYDPQSHLDALKAVNWNQVDYLVVHWAGNDPGNVRIDDPTDEFNTRYYLGAWRYCIKKLWEAHPQMQILYVSATYHEWPSRNESTDTREYIIDGQTYHYYDWADAIIQENKKLAIPSLDFYRDSGLNKYNIAYYMSSDRTHPNPIGNRMMASKIAAKLLSTF